MKTMKIKYLALALLTGFASVEAAAPPRKDIPAIAKAANGAIVTIIAAANDKPIAQGTADFMEYRSELWKNPKLGDIKAVMPAK